MNTNITPETLCASSMIPAAEYSRELHIARKLLTPHQVAVAHSMGMRPSAYLAELEAQRKAKEARL